jgi:hypothetical protein
MPGLKGSIRSMVDPAAVKSEPGSMDIFGLAEL